MFGFKFTIVCAILAWVSLITPSNCYTYRTMAVTHPDHPGKCYWAHTKTPVDVNAVYRIPNDCAEAACYADFSFTVMGCGVQMFDDPSCREIEPDLNLPYPRCCERWECVDADGNAVRL